jgi:hypothetical protein
MFGLNLKLVLGVAVLAVIGGLGSFAGCEHHNAKVARAERDAAYGQRDTAIDANHSQANTIDAQTKALAKWKALAASPEDMQAIIDQSNANAREINSLRGIIAKAKGKDRDLPDCIKLLSISLRRTCPSVAAGLRDLASGHQNNHGGNPGTSREAVTGRLGTGL